MLRAREIMTKNPAVLSSGQKFADALAVFQGKKVTCLPVIGADRNVVGLMTDLSFLKAAVICRSKKDLNIPLKEFQNLFQPAQVLKDDDSLDLIVATMIKSSPHRIVVMDGMGKISGIISPKDLIKFITENGAKGEEVAKAASASSLPPEAAAAAANTSSASANAQATTSENTK